MNRIFLYIYFIILIQSSLFSQTASISGKIVSTLGSPISYASIKIENKEGTIANEKGEFLLSNLEEGIYQLEFSSIGYETYLLSNVELNAVNQHIFLGEIKLIEKSIQISEVTITEQLKVFDNRYSATNHIISAKTIRVVQPIGSEELLKTLPGVNISSDMDQSNRPNISIRGSDPRRSNKILLMEDGAPVSPAPYLAPGTYYNVPADRLEGIQIIKGPDVLAFGSNNIYGMVNYITKRPPQDPTLSLKLTGGSHHYFTGIGSYGGTWKNTGAEVQTLYKNFGGFVDNSEIKLLNISGKLYSELGNKSTIYIKLNYQQEFLNTTWNGNTPFTFSVDPTQNPFDADEFYSRRYGMDAVYNYSLNKSSILQTKIYYSDFYRDWWKQTSTVIKAQDAKSYLGEAIYNDRFSYLDGLNLSDNDFVRVGKVINGIESTTDSRWQYRVLGLQEKYSKNFGPHLFEAAVKWHHEYFNDVVLNGDSSRWARSGRITRDDLFSLDAFSLYAKNNFEFGNFSLIPIVRIETISIRKVDALKNAMNTSTSGTDFSEVKNQFNEFMPGASFIYHLNQFKHTNFNFFVGTYKGFSSPTSAIAFNEVTNGEVTPVIDIANLKPEHSFNQEVGVKFENTNLLFNGQISYFHSAIENYYSPARSQAFQTLGSADIQGIEFAMNIAAIQSKEFLHQSLTLNLAATYMQSKITSGTMVDFDLFAATVFHTDETKQELISMINENRNAYVIYNGINIISTEIFSLDDFSSFTKIESTFGNGFIENNDLPYIPQVILNTSVQYKFKQFGVSTNVNYVSEQFTEYLNFENETADGGIGKIPAYLVLDANIEYDVTMKNGFKTITIFAAGKNITNQIYKASRLNRATGGIFPAGFMQVNAGISFQI